MSTFVGWVLFTKSRDRLPDADVAALSIPGPLSPDVETARGPSNGTQGRQPSIDRLRHPYPGSRRQGLIQKDHTSGLEGALYAHERARRA